MHIKCLPDASSAFGYLPKASMPWPGNSCPTVPGEPATATEPNEGAFDNPSPWLLFKALGGVRAFEDLDSTSAHASQRAAHFVVGVAAARKDMVQPWIEPLDYRQRLSCTVTVRSCPLDWCNSAVAVLISGGFGCFDQTAATGGRLARGSSLKGAMVSSVM